MKKLLSFITALGIVCAAAPYTVITSTPDSFEAAAADPVEGEDVLIAVVDAETMDYIPGVTVEIYLDNYKTDTVVTEASPVIYHHGGHSGTISIVSMPAGYTYAEGFTKERAFMEDSESAVLWLEIDGSYVPETTESVVTTGAPETTTTSSATTSIITTSATASSTSSTTVTTPVELPEEVTKGDITYALSEKYASVLKCSDTASGHISILTSVNYKPVEYIMSNAFKRSEISSVTIPNTVKGIFTYAFNGCSRLTTVTVPASVKSIEKGAFQDCFGLKSIFILNPDCEIDDSPYTISNDRVDGTGDKPDARYTGIIYGYKDSTAQAYAEKNGCKFVALDGEDSAKADVFVSIADDKKTLQTAYEKVTAYDINADGIVSVDEALYSAHDKFYEGGASAGYRSVISTFGITLQKLWGIENGGAFGYTVNSKFSNSLDDEVQSGDSVYAFAYSDLSTFSDSYTKFGSYTVSSDAGEPIALTLSRSVYDSDYKQQFKPLDEAVITVDGKPTEYTTDEKGQVSILINEAGKHVISAVSEKYNIVPPVCIAEIKGTATERPEPTLKGDANLDDQVNIADAVLVMQVSTNPDKYARDKTDLSITLQGEVNADVDGSAGLSNSDALLIQKFKLGLIEKF